MGVSRVAIAANLAWLQRRFNQLSLRERAMLLLAMLGVFYFLIDNLVLASRIPELERVERTLASKQTTLDQLHQQTGSLQRLVREDPNQALRQREGSLRERINAARLQLQALGNEMISPQQTASLMGKVLADQEGLNLIKVQSLPPTVINENAVKNGLLSQGVFPIYAHGMAIEFSGDYFATLRYLESLEALPTQFYWDKIDFSVTDYPNSEVRLQIHTLSLSEVWIGV